MRPGKVLDRAVGWSWPYYLTICTSFHIDKDQSRIQNCPLLPIPRDFQARSKFCKLFIAATQELKFAKEKVPNEGTRSSDSDIRGHARLLLRGNGSCSRFAD
jgi:hypothetical protein